MDQVTVKAPAKLNLALDITGKTQNGYHLMKMVMQAIDLYDTIRIRKNDTGKISLSCGLESVPCDERNIAYAAAEAFFQHCGIEERGVEIRLDKVIPQQAGMAGGSADGAGTLTALNELYQTGLSLPELCGIGKTVGADLPFCLTGGTAVVEGIGEIITPIADFPDCDFVVAKPKGGISTQRAFSEFDRAEIGPCLDITAMVKAIEDRDAAGACAQMYNALARVCPLKEVEAIQNIMTSCGAKGALMTGSGSAVFGVFTDRGKAYACERRLSQRYEECFLCKPISHGPVIE